MGVAGFRIDSLLKWRGTGEQVFQYKVSSPIWKPEQDLDNARKQAVTDVALRILCNLFNSFLFEDK